MGTGVEAVGFETMYGQQLLRETLRRTLAGGETGHAYLFSGPPGSGKKTLSLLLAQGLNCTEPDPPCGQCLSCRKSASGNHPDLYRLLPQGASLKIEQLREIRESLYYRPMEGTRKICIIEDADLLTAPAANSLLKILEEPPARLVFILLSTRPWSLPPTILSRCASFTLKPLLPQEMAALLDSRVKVPLQEQEMIISLSQGNPGRALAQAAKGQWREQFTEAQALLHKVEQGPVEGIFILAEELGSRSDLPALLDMLLFLYRDRLMGILPGCTTQDNADLRVCSLEKICRALLQLQEELWGNVNRRLALEVLFLQMKGVI